MSFYATTDSPIGELLLAGDGENITHLYMAGAGDYSHMYEGRERDQAIFADAVEQLDQYFGGELTRFDLPLAPRGSEFQIAVWKALREIPYGETRTYGEIAEQVGMPQAARAVGTANNRNPIAVIVPCHRVIGAGGKLVGYAGGLDRKQQLLELESGVRQL
ncbi:MAG: methylated-DNA--[protein]-cysteine S-methyltransferase [Solirubrobacterales bacterium]